MTNEIVLKVNRNATLEGNYVLRFGLKLLNRVLFPNVWLLSLEVRTAHKQHDVLPSVYLDFNVFLRYNWGNINIPLKTV